MPGNTHEDIDALFGVIRNYLKGKSWRNLDEYTALVRAALASYPGGIVVEVVSDTLDFAGWLKPCTNKNLALFFSARPGKLSPGHARCQVRGA